MAEAHVDAAPNEAERTMQAPADAALVGDLPFADGFLLKPSGMGPYAKYPYLEFYVVRVLVKQQLLGHS